MPEIVGRLGSGKPELRLDLLGKAPIMSLQLAPLIHGGYVPPVDV